MRELTKPMHAWMRLPHSLTVVWLAVLIMVSGSMQTRSAFLALQDPDRSATTRVYEVVHHDEKVLVGAYHRIGRKPFYAEFTERQLPPPVTRLATWRPFVKLHPRAPPHSPRAPPRFA